MSLLLCFITPRGRLQLLSYSLLNAVLKNASLANPWAARSSTPKVVWSNSTRRRARSRSLTASWLRGLRRLKQRNPQSRNAPDPSALNREYEERVYDYYKGRRAMRIKDLMSSDVEVIRPATTVADVAELMKTLDLGVMPICVGGRLIGILTDRDIVVRG